MEEHEVTFGQRLRQFRLRIGLSQAALARRAHLSAAAVATIERGVRGSPYPRTLEALATALDLSLEERVLLAEAARPRRPRTSATVSGRAARASSLPVPRTSLIGREREIDQLCTLIARPTATHRLITLTGSGGVGKTSLALAVADRLRGTYADQVWLAWLAPLPDPGLVPSTVAAAIGVSERGGPPLMGIVEALRERRALLVLDNCEHLIQASAELVDTLLETCAGLTILATSRELLGVPGEMTLRVPSLSVPRSPAPTVEQLAQYDAVRLLVDRAATVRPDFAVTEANAAAVGEVCRRLDGIPLAIELAAAWLHTLSVEQLAVNLDDRFRLLVGGSRTAPPRQQTLRGAIDWSYELLSQPARRLFARLGVFAGGWTLEAAETVCSGEGLAPQEVLGCLRQLVEKSLVVVESTPDGTRYRLLESLQVYARELARASGELPRLQRRHLDWCLALARSVSLPWPSTQQIRRLVEEQDNFRVALRYCVQDDEATLGLHLAVALWPLWYIGGLYTDGRIFLGELLALPDGSTPGATRARALAFVGELASLQGHLAEADAVLHEGFTMAEQAGATFEQALCSLILGELTQRRGVLAEARAYYERALALARLTGRRLWEAWAAFHVAQVCCEIGDSKGAASALGVAVRLSSSENDPRLVGHLLALRGQLAELDGDHQAALMLVEQSLALLREIGDQQGLALRSVQAAAIAFSRGDRPDAGRHLATALTVARESGEKLVVARALEGVAQLIAAAEPARAVGLAGAAAALRATLGFDRTLQEQARLERWLAAARSRLGHAAYAKAWERGRGGAAQQVAVALSLAEGVTDRDAGRGSDVSPLTRREREVALLLGRGLTNRQVASELVISEGTARIHVQRVLGKLGLRSRVQVATWARARGLLDDQGD